MMGSAACQASRARTMLAVACAATLQDAYASARVSQTSHTEGSTGLYAMAGNCYSLCYLVCVVWAVVCAKVQKASCAHTVDSGFG